MNVFVSAGEHSGDLIAAPVIRELKQLVSDFNCFGVGGAALRQEGVEVRHHCEELAVTGVTEALGKSPRVGRMFVDLWRQIRSRRPALALLVDYPGVNLRWAKWLHQAGTPVLYYVAPQRWAWLGFRTRPLRCHIDRLAVTLPFEESWFRQRGVPCTFVGHPVLDNFKAADPRVVRGRLGLGDSPVIALCPGSRTNEILRHLPLLKQSLSLMPRHLSPVLATLPGAGAELCRRIAPRLPQARSAEALSVAQVALCASGSVTLEAALAGVPSAVFYRLSKISYALGRMLVRVPHISLPNLILGEPLLPELIQGQMTPARLARVAMELQDPHQAKRIRAGLTRAVDLLGQPGAARRVARLGYELIGAAARISSSRAGPVAPPGALPLA